MYIASIIGRLVKDAEEFNNGSSSFISCSAFVKRTNSKEDRWVSLYFDSARYKNILPYLTKGLRIYASGSEDVHGYLMKNGEIGVETKIWVDNINFISSPRQNDQAVDDDKKNEKMAINVDKFKKDTNTTIKENDDLPF